MFPNLIFVWLRRDIGRSALSDLEARYRRGGIDAWNSATTSNYREIQKLPYWEQVVEQQYEYSECVAHDLKTFGKGRYLDLWYEEICDYTEREVEKLTGCFSAQSFPLERNEKKIPLLARSDGPTHLSKDFEKIHRYVETNVDRFRKHIHKDTS